VPKLETALLGLAVLVGALALVVTIVAAVSGRTLDPTDPVHYPHRLNG